MLHALVADLQGLGCVHLTTTRDSRLAPLEASISCLEVGGSAVVWSLWRQCIRAADAVWPVAPETEGVLERLSRMVLEEGRILIGCHPEAIEIAASKYRTAEVLRRFGITVVETRPLGAGIPHSLAGWVVKPDDGAGCEAISVYSDRCKLEERLSREMSPGVVVQPYVPGIPASLSLLCYDGSAQLLSCNLQLINIRGRELRSAGVSVNALAGWREALQPLAQRIAAAVPGLRGYVGVDLVLSEDGPVVIEINPRLTTSYVGLTEALGENVAARILRGFRLTRQSGERYGTAKRETYGP